jgi:hypothetical protein
MPMTDPALLAEINADPAGLGYGPFRSAGNDAGIVKLLNDRTRGLTVPQVASWSAVLKWLAQQGYRSKLQDASTTAAAANRDAALAILDLIHGAAPGFDVTDAAMVALFNAVIPAASQAALLALGNVPASRAEVLFGYGTTPTDKDVSRVLRGTS